MTVIEAARRVLETLPEEIREEVEGVRLAVMPAPTEDLLEVGISETTPAAFLRSGDEPFFDGDDEQDRVIYLFTDNIRPLSQKHVEKLVLHEIGHALGMDEDEVRSAVDEDEDE